jgi:hypothetical protein
VKFGRFAPLLFEHVFVYATRRAGLEPQDQTLTWPVAASLERCAELLGVELAAVAAAAAHVEPYLRVDGTKIWSLTQLERHLHPDAYGRVRGGYIARRRPPAAGA